MHVLPVLLTTLNVLTHTFSVLVNVNSLWHMQVVGVNEVNEAIIPFTEASHILREQDMKGNPVTHHITDRSV